MAVDLLDAQLRRMAPALRESVGHALLSLYEEGGADLGDFCLQVLRPEYDCAVREHPEEARQHTKPAHVLPVLAIRVHTVGKACSFEQLLATDEELNQLDERHHHEEPHPDHPHEQRAWPTEWLDERDEVVVVDVELDVAVRTNWSHEPIFFAIFAVLRHLGSFSLRLATLGVLAFVLRAHVKVWWHIGKGQLKLVVLERES